MIKIADFGLVTIHGFAQQSHTIDKGTIKYMAPQITKSSKYDAKSDIYNLYVIMQELFCIEDNRHLLNVSKILIKFFFQKSFFNSGNIITTKTSQFY